MSPAFTSLSVRNYRIYFAGSLISNIGTWLQQTALAWLMLQLTGSGTALGATIGLYLLPTLLLSPLAGLVADRLPKRKLMLWMQVAMSIPSAALGLLAIFGQVVPWQVFALTFLLGIGRAFEAPARQSFVSEMVDSDRLANAVSLNSASFNSGRLIGPGLAGLLIAALGSGVSATGWVILLNAISFWFVVVALLALDRTDLTPAPLAKAGKGSIRDGARYVRSRPDLVLLLVTVAFLGAFGMNFQLTSALMATEVFGKGAGEFGVLGSILAIGSLSGALLAARRPRPRLRFIVGAALLFSVVQVISGLMPSYWLYAAVLPLVGISLLTAGTTASAVIQLTTIPQMRGRVVSIYLMVFLGSTPIGAPLIGWIGEYFGPREAVVVSGLITGLGVLTAAVIYGRRHAGKVPADVAAAARRVLAQRTNRLQTAIRRRIVES